MFKLVNVDAEIDRARRRLHRAIDGANAPITIEGSDGYKSYRVMVGEYEVTGVVSIEFEIHPRIHEPVVVIKAAIDKINISTKGE